MTVEGVGNPDAKDRDQVRETRKRVNGGLKPLVCLGGRDQKTARPRMPIWRVTEEGPERIARSSLRKERLLEEKLEGWIAADPSILGESLLLLGRQVTVPKVNDRLDLLALDTQGNAVVMEKRQMSEIESLVVQAAGTGEELQFEEDLESESPVELEPDKRSIRTKSADPEIDSLYGKWKRGRLVLQPDFQRHFVWDRKKASRLIESALLSVPLPIIYLAEEDNNRESVIDGQQRLTAFFNFMDGRWGGGPFKLTGLEVFREYNGLTFADLTEDVQDKIKYCEVRAITILRGSDSELKFEIFERLNTGAMPLNDMELRNCIYRGPYLEALKGLSKEPDFMQLLGLKEPDKRMRDVELALRFSAFYNSTYLRYQPPVRRFLNDDMERNKNWSPSQETELRNAFKNALMIVKSLFGEYAFKRLYPGNDANPNGWWEPKRFNASLFDVWMGIFAEVDKNRAYAALDRLREGLIQLMSTNFQFIQAIQIGTSQQVQVRTRFDLARQTVEEILRDHAAQPRCFSAALKRDLFGTAATCAICGNAIQIIDDAHVDHIRQYWTGGETIPENARLTHRFCNMARPRGTAD